MMKSLKCNLKKNIESIQISNIVYRDDTIENNSSLSSFNPGNTCDEKKLTIKLISDVPFYTGTKLKLKLIGVKDQNYVMTYISPIKVHKQMEYCCKSVIFNFISCNIPTPFGLLYLPTIITDNRPYLQIGNALEYCFVLSVKCCDCKFDVKIPLTARYLGTDVKTDFKYEKPDLVESPDEDHTIKIICNADINNPKILYCRKIHCVTHSQAPKPIVFYYKN